MLRFPEHACVAAPDISLTGTVRDAKPERADTVRAIVHPAAAATPSVIVAPSHREPAQRMPPRCLTFASKVPPPGSPMAEPATTVGVRARVHPKADAPAPTAEVFERAAPRAPAWPRALAFTAALTRGVPDLAA